MMVTKDLSSGHQLRKVKKKLSKKDDFMFRNMKKTESPKMTSKILYELWIKSYEQFKYFSQTWNLTISKNTSVNHRTLKHYEKSISSAKISKKCNFKKQTQNPSGSLNPQLQRFNHLRTIRKYSATSRFRSSLQNILKPVQTYGQS